MTDNVQKLETTKSIRQEAEAEFQQEQRKRSVVLMKEKIKARAAAQLIVDNCNREIEDLEQRLNQGDVHP